MASSALFDRDLDKLLEIALPFFNNPMYIADSAFVCLARTKNYSVKNMTVQWDEISNRGVLKVAVKPSTISQLDKLKKASFSYSDDRAERNIAAHIERDGKRVANLCIIESDNKCYDFHLDLADYLCKCIESVIETKYYLESSSSIVYEEWLMLLCMGKPVRNGVIVPHLNELGWNDVGYFRIAIVDFINKLDSESTLSYRRRELDDIFEDSASFMLNGFMVFVSHFDSREQAKQAIDVRIIRYVEENDLLLSQSSYFSDIRKAADYYEQARRIMKFANTNTQHIRYEECMVDDHIESVASTGNIDCNVLPEIKELMLDDERKKTDLLETLDSYMDNNQSLAKCANELFIHRNTLLYRLNKIQSQYGIDLDDPSMTAAIILSCKVCLKMLDNKIGADRQDSE